jgi:hypothetical protein
MYLPNVVWCSVVILTITATTAAITVGILALAVRSSLRDSAPEQRPAILKAWAQIVTALRGPRG